MLICQWDAVKSVLVLVMAVVFSLLHSTMVTRSSLDSVEDLVFLAAFEDFFDFLHLLRLLFFAILFVWFGAITYLVLDLKFLITAKLMIL